MDYFDLKLQQRFAPEGAPRNVRREEELFYTTCAPSDPRMPARLLPGMKALVKWLRGADTRTAGPAGGQVIKAMG